MNKKIYAALLAAVMMMSLCAGALAQSPAATPVPMEYAVNPAKITVQGRAQVLADPDMDGDGQCQRDCRHGWRGAGAGGSRGGSGDGQTAGTGRAGERYHYQRL